MALSGYFYGTTANARIKPKLSWSAVQNTEENCSDITVTLTYSRTNSGYKTEGEWSGAITVGDQRKTGKKYIVITKNSDTVAMTATFRVMHDQQGALSVTVSAEGDIPDTTLQSTNISGEIQLDAIVNASSVSATAATIGECSWVLIGQNGAGFVNSLSYEFGNLRGWIGANGEIREREVRFSDPLLLFRLPESFYYEMPNDTQRQCRLTCYTYQGDIYLGKRETSFTVTVDRKLCAPTLTVTAKDVNPNTLAVTGDSSKIIRYGSRVLCQLDAQGQKGASIVCLRAGNQVLSGNQYVLETADTSALEFFATDSRGFTTRFLLTLEMLPYIPLTVNATVQRTDPTSGDAILTLQGRCWQGAFPKKSNTLNAICILGDKHFTTSVEIGENHTYHKEILLTGLDYRQSHKIELEVYDEVIIQRQSLSVQKGLPVFDWGEEDFRFHVPVDLPALTIDGVPLATYIQNAIENYVNQ